jgi:hypothetical protein
LIIRTFVLPQGAHAAGILIHLALCTTLSGHDGENLFAIVIVLPFNCLGAAAILVGLENYISKPLFIRLDRTDQAGQRFFNHPLVNH